MVVGSSQCGATDSFSTLLGSRGPAEGAAVGNLACKSDRLVRLGVSTFALEMGVEDEGKGELQKVRAGKVFGDKPIHSSLFAPGHSVS